MFKALFKLVFEVVLTPLFSVLGKKLAAYLKLLKVNKRAKEEADSAKEKMEQAKTAKEIDDASDSTLDNI